MESKTKGWVIVNYNHPSGRKPFILLCSFALTKRQAIAEFIKETNELWKYWKTKYKFQCVKANSTITVNTLSNE